MEGALALVLAVIALGFLAAWYYALYRAWRHTTRDQTRAERHLLLSGLAVLILVPVGLAVLGASPGTAIVVIAIAMALVVPVLIIIGARDHRRRETRIRASHHGTSAPGE